VRFVAQLSQSRALAVTRLAKKGGVVRFQCRYGFGVAANKEMSS
jgi:hypothetical protein